MNVHRVIETCVYVNDLDAAEAFYADVLGLTKYAKVAGRHLFFRCGDGMLLLFRADATEPSGTGGIPPHGARGPGHVAFEMEPGELGSWREHLHKHGVPIESDFTWPNGGRSLYFRDPAGNSLELVTPDTWGLAGNYLTRPRTTENPSEGRPLTQ